MTTTPDTALAARLAAITHGDLLMDALDEAWAVGQLITLADHERAVQAAVAKAVEAEREACITIADDAMIRHMPLCCDEDEWRADEAATIAAAIRARKGDAL